MQPCSLAATDLACRRGDRVLFRGLSLALQPGDAVQVAGANGIGKSSLLRILAGLLRPFAGAVVSQGAIGLIDERPALDPHLPLGQALAFWRRIDGPTDDTAAQLGLGNLLDVPVRFLSTGQKKRAALARLIGQGAPIWLLDEPLNGLDSDAARLAEEIAAAHCAGGGICIIASHQRFALPGLRRIELATYSPPLQGRGRGWGASPSIAPAAIPHPKSSPEGEEL
jgi:heme exporter protein A